MRASVVLADNFLFTRPDASYKEYLNCINAVSSSKNGHGIYISQSEKTWLSYAQQFAMEGPDVLLVIFQLPSLSDSSSDFILATLALLLAHSCVGLCCWNFDQDMMSQWLKVFDTPNLVILPKETISKSGASFTYSSEIYLPILSTLKITCSSLSVLSALRSLSQSATILGCSSAARITPFFCTDMPGMFYFEASSMRNNRALMSLRSDEGIVFTVHDQNFFLAFFIDLSRCCAVPIFASFFSTIRELVEPLRGFGDADSDSQLTYRRSQPPRTEQSMSLSDWNPEEFVGTDKLASHSISHSMPSTERERLKRVNKDTLKKLILLALRRLGIKKTDRDFLSVWKHLYCGCLFALRKELMVAGLDQNLALKTIKDNIKFLNIGQHAKEQH